MSRPHPLHVAPIAALLLASCTTTGSGAGEVSGNPNAPPVAFKWTSENGGQSGTMSAVLNGVAYSGPFFQIRSTTETYGPYLAPLWYGWSPWWPNWSYWGPAWGLAPDRAFVTRYSGKVVANLASAAGKHMRCRFHLADPPDGMSGGGQGECQLQPGETINATFSG